MTLIITFHQKIMFKVRLSFVTLRWACLTLLTVFLTTKSTATSSSIGKAGCPTHCGNITVPYPFGLGLDGACSIGYGHNINCNTSYDPPKAFLEDGNLEIVDFSLTDAEMRVIMFMATKCYDNGELLDDRFGFTFLNLYGLPLVMSETANKFTLVGCDNFGVIGGTYGVNNFTGGIISVCSEPKDVISGACSGSGCSQASIPKGLKGFGIDIGRVNITNVSYFNNCSYAFLGEYSKYTFNSADLADPEFKNRMEQNIRIVLDWTVGGNQTCDQAQKNKSSYACRENAFCSDFNVSTEGYRCICHQGYEGNAYLRCTDTDECAGPNNPCSDICTNGVGTYECSCLRGRSGDGHKNGSGCTSKRFAIATGIGLGFCGLILLLLMVSWVYIMVKRRKHMKMREKFFEQNGGLLLKQQISSQAHNNPRQETSSKIFSADELAIATNNYSEDRILGKGGHGMVYKGIFENGQEVAIKKAKFVDQTQIEQFINEVVILTQINHRNVVKLLGCCLETEVPLLVYEYISNGTLSEHIHNKDGATSWLKWADCVRVASEAANAFAYLHSEASIPIFHRDVKSANILLDKSNTTKIADFGASRLIPIGRSEVTTLVQGTIGYLDPEYLLTSQLTDKSDVYSFGVVLTELLTKDRPTSHKGNLSIYFLLALRQGRLLEIVDAQLLEEASEEQLYIMADLIKGCLSVKGDDRPTMKEVAIELEGLKRQVKHLLNHQNDEEKNIVSHSSTSEFSMQYTAQMEMMTEMNHPR